MLQQWEYAKQPLSDPECASFLAEAGKHGWELVAVQPATLHVDQAIAVPGQRGPAVIQGWMAFMKRPMQFGGSTTNQGWASNVMMTAGL